jgi:hypothetical protein
MQRISGKMPWRQTCKRAKLKARPAETYRAGRRNRARGMRRCDLLKEERELTGETRRQMDQRREAMRQLRVAAEQMQAMESRKVASHGKTQAA